MRHVLVSALFLAACAGTSTGRPTIVLWNGRDLAGWHADVPAADGKPDAPPSFAARDGVLVSLGNPPGHLISNDSFGNYRLTVEWRWPGQPGNCGVLIHTTKVRRLANMFPQSLECQLHHGNAGDFWCIGEDVTVPDMETRRGPKERWGVDGDRLRRIKNLTDDSEKAPGEWNTMVIECSGRNVSVWVNGTLVNQGSDCTAERGQIALQAEGAVCEFRKVEVQLL